MRKFTKPCVIVFICLIVSALAVSSCKKDDNDSTPPDAITDLSAVPGVGEVTLSWTNPENTDLDQIEISVTPGGYVPETVTSETEEITITNLSNGTEYTFSLKAIDEAGNKSDSVSVTGTPNTRFRVEDPELATANSQDFSLTETREVIVEVTFNRAVDTSTVVPGETIYILYGTTVVSGTVTYSNEYKTISFTTTESIGTWCNFSPDCQFRFVLVGNDAGQGVIKDSGNMTLDGDDDATLGGNYEIDLILPG